MGARFSLAFGAAVQRPVVEDRELAVRGRVDVEFESVSAKRECGFHRGNRVFKERMAGWQHAFGRAGVGAEILAVEILRQAAMRKHGRGAAQTARQQRAVVEPDARSDDNGNEEDCPFAQDVIPILAPHLAPGSDFFTAIAQ